MTWWAWTAIWLMIGVGAGTEFFLIGRSLWREASALITELTVAAERLSTVSDKLNTVTSSGETAPAVTQLRRERYLAARGAARSTLWP